MYEPNLFLYNLTQPLPKGDNLAMQVLLELPPLPYYITIGKVRYKPGEQHPNRHNIGIFDWIFVIQGTLYIGEDDKQWEVEAGHSLLLLPDRYHYAVKPCHVETVFYWIHYAYGGIYRIEEQHNYMLPLRHAWANPSLLRILQFQKHHHFNSITLLLKQLSDYTASGGTGVYWKEQQLFLELIERICSEEEGQSIPTAELRLAERTESYLRQHYRRELTNETLAEALHFHPNYIVRCMKAVYRCTPMAYLHKIRLEHAKMLLIKTELPVTSIAENVGFQYAPYFSRCFKRYTGLAPLAFRKQYSNER